MTKVKWSTQETQCGPVITWMIFLQRTQNTHSELAQQEEIRTPPCQLLYSFAGLCQVCCRNCIRTACWCLLKFPGGGYMLNTAYHRIHLLPMGSLDKGSVMQRFIASLNTMFINTLLNTLVASDLRRHTVHMTSLPVRPVGHGSTVADQSCPLYL